MTTEIISTTLEYVLDKHLNICQEAREIVGPKGHDYNKQEQEAGDTLGSLRYVKRDGITKSNCQTILVTLRHKFSRLKSLTLDPTITPEVKDEDVRQTIRDTINYLVYLEIFYEEERSKEKTT